MFSALKNLSDKALCYTERFSSGKRWGIKISVLAFFLSLFSAFPSYDIFFNNYDRYKHHWYGIHDQIKNPLTFKQYSILHHSANTTYRITGPCIAYLSGFSSANLISQIVFCLVLHLVALFILLWAIAKICFNITQDKIIASILCLSFALIYAGNSLTSDLWAGMDIIGYCFLALALLSKRPLPIMLFVLLASFTDERALIASCLVFVWQMIESKNISAISYKDIFILNKKTIAVVIGWLIYFTLRLYLELFQGWKTNIYTADIAITVIKEGVSNIPFGMWSALEGFWLPVLGALLVLATKKRWSLFLLIASGIGIVSVVAFSVLDISRSIAYVFPVAFIGLYIVSQNEKKLLLRYFSLAVFLLCLFPTCYVFGHNNSKWLYPLPLQLLRMISGSETFSLTF